MNKDIQTQSTTPNAKKPEAEVITGSCSKENYRTTC
jgi:hypothetical protein